MTRRAIAAVAALAATLGLLSAAPLARADGDPASDELVSADVFLPYAPPASASSQRRLEAMVAGARRAGYPLKVAVIGSTGDMGSVGSLFGRPATYAKFLSAEDASLIHVPILVVMPAGVALARGGTPMSTASPRAPSATGPSTDGLVALATRAVARQSAAAGHPIQAADVVAPTAPPLGAGTATWIAAGAIVLLAALGAWAGLRARRRIVA